MLYSIKNLEDLKDLIEAVSLQNQVKAVKLQDRLGEPNYHQNAEKLCKPFTDSIKTTFENLSKTITETSINNNKAIENLKEKYIRIDES